MNDRFKFRAWDKGNQIMHYDFQFIKTGEEDNAWICFISDKQPMKCDKTKIIFDSPYFRQQIEIMQSTGLKDKNDKLIYEGDILKDKYGAFHPISWNVKGFYEADTFAVAGFYNAIQEDMEVIGNKFENPELLKECE